MSNKDGWVAVQCHACVNGIVDRGYLEVRPEDCGECVGGTLWQHLKTGTLAQYPGGPLRGRLTGAPR